MNDKESLIEAILETIEWCGPLQNAGVGSTTYIFGLDKTKAKIELNKILANYEISERPTKNADRNGSDG